MSDASASDGVPVAALLAARCVWEHWQAGQVMTRLPEACRPRTRAEGYAAQALLPPVSGRGLIGWKIAATSRAGQAHIAVEGPLAGRLLEGQVQRQGLQAGVSGAPRDARHESATLSLHGNRMRVAEPEFVFRMGRDLVPRARPYGVEEVLDAVAALHPGIEVPDSRFADFAMAGEAQLLADNACAGQFVLGREPGGDGWRSLDLAAHRAFASVRHADGSSWEREGLGANVLDDPRRALAWLANELSALGVTLAAGHLVTTGTCMPPLPIAPGDEVAADFGVLGSVSVRFAPQGEPPAGTAH